MVWGLGLALLALNVAHTWVIEGGWDYHHMLPTPPPHHDFPNIFRQVGKRAVLMGKMLGGTTNL